jgi:excisionase family DNA binding protein
MSSLVTGALLGADEVGARLGVSRQTVYRLVREGHLPAVRLADTGSSLRFDPERLERWIAARETGGRS